MSKHFNLTKIKQLTYYLLTALTLVSQGWGTSPTKEQITPEKSLKRRSISILLVEDNSLQMKIYRNVLEKAGFKVSTAENGQSALDSMNNRHLNNISVYDYIITDFQMPVMNGAVFCNKLMDPNILNNPENEYGFDLVKTTLIVQTTDEINSNLTEQFPNQVKLFKKDSQMKEIIKLIKDYEASKLIENHPDKSRS